MGNKLTDMIDKTDLHMSKENGAPPEVYVFLRIYNPLTLYSRLIDAGFDKEDAKYITDRYEWHTWKGIDMCLKSIYKQK